ncbi:hypothetical protein [Bacillus sp. 2205SS5-2]|uniref:hypothetical protein n=1 Tax=Bacillus sp. 2205SS5-2 TaxID=3109031 RepID=UPI00300610F2
MKQSDLSLVQKFHLDVGTHEATSTFLSEMYLQSSQRVYSILKEKVNHTMCEIIVGGNQQKNGWKIRLPLIFDYLIAKLLSTEEKEYRVRYFFSCA